MIASGTKQSLAPCFSNPTNTAASSNDLRVETTASAGTLSSGKPTATQIMITLLSGVLAIDEGPHGPFETERV